MEIVLKANIFNSSFVKYDIPLLTTGKNKYMPKYWVKYQYLIKITGKQYWYKKSVFLLIKEGLYFLISTNIPNE